MWQTTPFLDLLSTVKCMSTEMHHCIFGSSRRKLTKLSHNKVSFHRLNQLCDNQHEHEPWAQKPDGCWATAEETAYPWPLAAGAIATQVVLELQIKGIECQLPSFAEQECTLQAMRASTNLQPRKNLPPLVPEFKQLIQQADSSQLPPHARKLGTPKRGYVASAPENHITVGVHFLLKSSCKKNFVSNIQQSNCPCSPPQRSQNKRFSLDQQDLSSSCQRAHRTSQEVDHPCNRVVGTGEETQRVL